MLGDRVMGDMYNYGTYSDNIDIINNACSSSSTAHDHHRSADDISLFLHQVLLHSPPSSSPSFLSNRGTQTLSLSEPPVTAVKDVIFGVDSFDGMDNGGYFPGNASGTPVNVSSSSIGGASDQNETDHECDCESEEGLEALMDEVPAKPAPPRSSKRSRAAEVHNLSEKRRRSRINEKMKALQNLIPNSNKTDKASMLDEAIEYLKQLQLQVQMLSMRNGISLHPMCLPGIQQPLQLSHARVGYGEETASQHVNTASFVSLDGETSAQTVFRPPNQCASLKELSIPNASNIIRSETSFGLESSISAHFGPFPFRTCSEEICRDDTLPYQHELNGNYTERDPLAMATALSLPFRTQASNLKDSISLEACMMGRDQAEGVLLKNLEHNLILHPDLNSLRTRRSALNAEVKIENPAI